VGHEPTAPDKYDYHILLVRAKKKDNGSKK